MDLKGYLTVSEFCKAGHTDRAPRTIQRWCTGGVYPHAVLFRKRWYIHPRHWQHWVERNSETSGCRR